VPVVTSGPSCWRTLFGHSLDFVDTILNKENQDTDIVKRATNILERAKTESTEVMVLTEPTRVKKVANHLQDDESNVVSDASTKTEEQSGPMNDDNDEEEAKPESSPEITNRKQQDNQLEAMSYIIQDTHISDDVVNDEQQVESSNEEQEEQETQQSSEEQETQQSNQEQETQHSSEEQETQHSSEEQEAQQSSEEQEAQHSSEEQETQHSSEEQETQHSSEEQETQQSNQEQETQQSNQEEQSNHDAQENQVSKANETKVKDDNHLSEAQTDDTKKAQPAPATNKPKNKKKNRKHK
jgi:hypothetical protein